MKSGPRRAEDEMQNREVIACPFLTLTNKKNIVRALSNNEITQFIQEEKNYSEKEGDMILNQFEKNQPQIYQAIFGGFSDGIAEENIDMSNLFFDLCFDILPPRTLLIH